MRSLTKNGANGGCEPILHIFEALLMSALLFLSVLIADQDTQPSMSSCIPIILSSSARLTNVNPIALLPDTINLEE